MGWKRGGVALYAAWEATGASWVTDDTVPDAVLGPLRDAGLLARATHYWVDEPTPRPLDVDALVKLAAGWRTEAFAVFAGDVDDPDWMLHGSLERTRFSIALKIGPSRLDDGTRDQVAALLGAWTERLAKYGASLSTARLESAAPYPRPMPPQEGTTWQLGALDTYLGRAWHARDPARAAVLAAIEAAPVPDGATRTTAGDVVRIGFAAAVTDPAAVAAARTAAEGWLAPLVPTNVAPGWNQHGDHYVVAIERDPLPPFTFYDSSERVGYKALIVDPDSHEVDEDMWGQLKQIAAARQTDDGTPVDAIRLVFPTRDDALRMYDRARADGFEMTLHPGEGKFWQVHPPADAN